MLQNIWKRLLENKKNQWLILLLVGILLVVIAIPTSSSADINYSNETSDWNVTETEGRLEKILGQMHGVGEVHVMITYRDEMQVEGVVVVVENGGNAVVVKQITEVVGALFHVDAHKIKVIASK